MDIVYIVLLALLAIYIPIFIIVKKGKWENKGLVSYGPAIMYRTSWGLKMMDRLAVHKKLWRIIGRFSMVVSFLLTIFIIAVLLIDLAMVPSAMASQGIGIRYALAIPGLNPMLPIVYGAIGLIVAVAIHELSHGIQSRANDIPVKSSGILYCVIPVGAFVEPDDSVLLKKPRRERMDVFAAGITANFILAVVCFLLVFTSASSLTSPYAGMPAVYGIADDSEAYNCGIPVSSIITEVDGVAVDGYDGFINIIDSRTSLDISSSNVSYQTKNGVDSKDMRLGVQIISVVKGSPAESSGFKSGWFITALGPDESNLSPICTTNSFTTYMQSTSPGESLTIRYCDEWAHYNVVVTLDGKDGVGFLGVSTSISGLAFTSPENILEQGINPFYGSTDMFSASMGLFRFIGAPFQGFSPVPTEVTWWYDAPISDDIYWILMYVIYWIFWLNLVLAISNAIPCMPFDGGVLFRGGVDKALESMGHTSQEERDRIADPICTFTSYLSLGILLLVLFAVMF